MLKRIPMTRREFIEEIKSQSHNLEELFDMCEVKDLKDVDEKEKLIKSMYISVKDLEHIFNNVFIVSKKTSDSNDKI